MSLGRLIYDASVNSAVDLYRLVLCWLCLRKQETQSVANDVPRAQSQVSLLRQRRFISRGDWRRFQSGLINRQTRVRIPPPKPSPKADSVQGLKAGKPLPAGCVQICPVSKAQLWERPFDLPALNRALLKMWGPLSSGRIHKRGTRRCSSVGRAPRREVCRRFKSCRLRQK